MIRRYETEDGVFIVDVTAKTVVPIYRGTARRARAYEFFEHLPDGGLYFHAFNPDTGALAPFTTSPVVTVT